MNANKLNLYYLVESIMDYEGQVGCYTIYDYNHRPVFSSSSKELIKKEIERNGWILKDEIIIDDSFARLYSRKLDEKEQIEDFDIIEEELIIDDSSKNDSLVSKSFVKIWDKNKYRNMQHNNRTR